jgi:hypothetical protein
MDVSSSSTAPGKGSLLTLTQRWSLSPGKHRSFSSMGQAIGHLGAQAHSPGSRWILLHYVNHMRNVH